MGLFSKLFGGDSGDGDGEAAPEGEQKPTDAAPPPLPGGAAPPRNADAAPPSPPRTSPQAKAPSAQTLSGTAVPATPAPARAAHKRAGPTRQATIAYDAAAAAPAAPPAAAPAPALARAEARSGSGRSAVRGPDRGAAVRAAPAVRVVSPSPVAARTSPVSASKPRVADEASKKSVPEPVKSASIFGSGVDDDDDIERVLAAEIDDRFDAVQRPAGATGSRSSAAERAAAAALDAAAARATFWDVAGSHLRLLRDAMLEMRHGSAASTALGPALAAVRVVESAAQKLDDRELAGKLGLVRERLGAADAAGSPEHRRAAKEAVLSAYASLVPVSPETLALDREHDRREPVIVRSLLLTVPGVEKLTMEKLFAAGLGRLGALLSASSAEIEQTSGVPPEIARGVTKRIAEYASEGGGTAVALDHEEERRRLGALLADLRREHEAFESASSRWSDADLEEKRRRRVARERVLRHIDLVLARVGAVERVAALERMPVRRRIDRLAGLASDAAAFMSPGGFEQEASWRT